MSRMRARGTGGPALHPGEDSSGAGGLRGHLFALEPQRAQPKTDMERPDGTDLALSHRSSWVAVEVAPHH